MQAAARKVRKASQPGAGATTLSLRSLNRALLARQMLLAREPIAAHVALERLIGLQAQSPSPPYFGLWTRLADFRPEHLSDLIEARRAVRISLMRSTIHLATARDALRLRPVLQSMHEAAFATGSRHGAAVRGVDMKALVRAGRKLVEKEPMTFTELGKRLQIRFPVFPADSLGYAVRNHIALVQIPPRGLWGRSGPPAHTSVEAWLGRPLRKSAEPDTMVLRYLAAFGPASVRDAQAWSGMTRLGAVFERLRAQLVLFRDEAGRELFDLPDAPRPSAEEAAPIRFLPEYDSTLLSHADRTRIISDADRKRAFFGSGGIVAATFLVDGFVQGTWKLKRRGKRATTLEVSPYRRLKKVDRRAVEEEGEALLRFAAPDVDHAMEMLPSG